jgi:mono/diheme cytochrome c family protein
VLAFARGEPLVELVANDPAAQTLRFFLVRFHPACETAGCSTGDLQTAAIESGWTGYSLYDDQTIADTTLDCLSCHQPGGPSTKKMLRMQELANPWAHWFYPERPDTLQIVQDFLAAHGGESYAGIPSALVMPSRPAALTSLAMNNGFASQPNAFDSLKINGELAATGSSATWAGLYARAVAGQEIPPSYFNNPYDRTKEQAAITAYQQLLAGTLPPAQLPDLRDTLLDAALAPMSIHPQAGLDGKGILVHMCQVCHNSRLDQTLSRARFNVEQLAQLSRGEKDLAIQRLQLPTADRHAMPPARFHELSAAERQLAIDELMK